MRPAQPMPAITQVRSGSSSSASTASIIARVTMPLEQPGHQSVLALRRWAVISAVRCGGTRGRLGVVGRPLEQLFVD